MKIRKYIKTLGALALVVMSTFMVACDSSGGGGGGGGGGGNADAGGGGAVGGAAVAEGFTRILLSGDAEGTQPIDTDDEIQIYIDGNRVQQTAWAGDRGPGLPAVPVVDVPVGSTCEFRFQPPANRPGRVGPVFINTYYEQQGQAMLQLGQFGYGGGSSAQPGVPAYICPIQVDSVGVPVIIGNPTPAQLGGEYILHINDSNGSIVQGNLPSNIRDGAVVDFGSQSVTIGGVTYAASNDPAVIEAMKQVEAIFADMAPPGLENFVIFVAGNIDDFDVIVYAQDGNAGGYLGWGAISGTNFNLMAAPYSLSND